MEFTKIQLTKQNTLTVVYKDDDGNVINFVGANIVHRDLREAMRALVPHLAVITEQREAYVKTYAELKAQSISDEDANNIYRKMSVEGLSLGNDQHEVSVQGIRILTKAGTVKVETPQIDLEDSDSYEHVGDMSLDVDAIIYEAKAYIEERKWGVKEASIDFKDIDPFDGEVKADGAPVAEGTAPKKRGRKSKKAA